LGVGGMAIVYLVEDIDLHKEYAAKVVRPERAASGEYSRELLLQEGRALTKLTEWTENVAVPFKIDVTKDGLRLPFLLMERLKGKTVRQLIEQRRARGRPLRVLHVLCGIRDVALVLAIAHKLEIVHR